MLPTIHPKTTVKPLVKITEPKVSFVKPTKPAISTGAATTTATHLSMLSISYGSRLPNIGNYTILLNNSIVPFDVLPKVVNGVPLTPFRHLFEQAGGKVKWEHASKTVLANGMGFDLSMKIGNPFALVNDEKIRMEMAPFIEKGRTVVPLSFIHDSLNVNVDYDPNTGHVLITTPGK